MTVFLLNHVSPLPKWEQKNDIDANNNILLLGLPLRCIGALEDIFIGPLSKQCESPQINMSVQFWWPNRG